MSKATGTYPAYVTVPPPPSAPAPSASAPQQAVINSQGQNLPPSSDQFQARLCACAQTPQKTCCRPARPWCFLDGCNQPPLSSVAAKYFTFVFFGLSVFVIVLFAGYVLVHCYRRIRNGPPQPDPADAEAGRAVPAKVVPMREGFMVTNPDGGLEVAYVSDTPRVFPKPGGEESAAGPSGAAAGQADVTRAAAGVAGLPVEATQTGQPSSEAGEISLASLPGGSGAR